MKINLHIERLVLEGLPITTTEGAVIHKAIEHELARMLASRSPASDWGTGGAIAQLGAPQIAIHATERPQALGRRIAHSVYGGVAGSVMDQNLPQSVPGKGNQT